MDKNFDEERLKKILAENYGGKAEEWHFVSMREGNHGQSEYVYHNEEYFNEACMDASALIDANGNILWPQEKTEEEKSWEQQAKKLKKQLAAAAAKPGDDAAAVKLTSLLSYEVDVAPDERDDIIAELLQKAGRALAKHFIFALRYDEEYDAPQVIITTDIYWKKNGSYGDQTLPVDHLLPKDLSNDMDSIWGWYGKEISAIDLCKKLQKAGFVWDRDFQDFIDKKLTQELSDALRTPFSTLLDGLEPVAGPVAPLRLDTDHEHHQLSPVNPSTADDKPASPPKKKLQKRTPKP